MIFKFSDTHQAHRFFSFAEKFGNKVKRSTSFVKRHTTVAKLVQYSVLQRINFQHLFYLQPPVVATKKSPFWASGSIYAARMFKLTPEAVQQPLLGLLREVHYKKQLGWTLFRSHNSKKIDYFRLRNPAKPLICALSACPNFANGRLLSKISLIRSKHTFWAGFPPKTFPQLPCGPLWF